MHRRRHIRYLERPRRWRKRAYMRLRRDIQQAAPQLGGLWYTDDYVHGENSWVDVYFIDPSTRTIYNATLDTLAYRAYEAAQGMALSEASDREPPQDLLSCFVREPGSRYARMVLPPDPPRQAFDGLSRRDWMKQRVAQLLDSGQVPVHPETTLHRNYGYGIGVHATLDVPGLSVPVITDWVRAFLANPVARRGEAVFLRSADMPNPGYASNALCAPADWPTTNQE